VDYLTFTGWDWVVCAFEKARASSKRSVIVVGFQVHGLEAVSAGILWGNLNKLAATDIPVYITEYDVNIENDND
jgi:GH35 family endo-1,4-beta-xylanase